MRRRHGDLGGIFSFARLFVWKCFECIVKLELSEH